MVIHSTDTTIGTLVMFVLEHMSHLKDGEGESECHRVDHSIY